MDLKEYLFKFKPENDAIEGIRGLEGIRPVKIAKPDLLALTANLKFIKIDGIGSFWDEAHPERIFGELLKRVAGILVGMASTGSPLVYVLQAVDQELALYFGSSKIELLKRLVTAQVPGCQFKEVSSSIVFNGNQNLPFYSAMAGNPAPAVSEFEKGDLPLEIIDQLIRGLSCQKKWTLFVIAQPFPLTDNRLLVQKWGTLSQHARKNFKPSDSSKMTDRLGEHYVDLLENQFQRATEGQGLGNWQTQVYVIDENGESASIAESIFCEAKAKPEVVRRISASENTPWGWIPESSTWLNSRELAYWMQLPISEYPGYQVQSYARFDVALPADFPRKGVNLGWIQDVSSPSGQVLFADPDELTGHILVAGTTNSGKTNTTFHLLSELAANNCTFLVIEPTKGEYRFLKRSFPSLKIYTMGNPESPLKINPFYVPAGVPVQMHLDYLLSLFSASFVLYAPMPYVLESALHEVYADRGWDLVNDVCIREAGLSENSRNPRSFPTLTDLLYKVEEVTDRLGYDDKISADVKAALRARINSLRVGSKGTMLDTQNSLDFKELMITPTIIEMGNIGDDEQKAFLIGLLLTRLFEHNIGSGIQVGKSKLRHITVIEEAHRLLQNTQTGSGGDFANPRGKAVETFCNLITEIRAYGEGFIIVEQSPVKLAPDVVKNTNFKIIHRIISADDRQALAQAMNLDEKMQQMLVGLIRGQAIVFAGGMDHPMRVKYTNKKEQINSAPDLTAVPAPHLTSIPLKMIPAAARLAEGYGIRLEFARWFLTVLSMGVLASDENRQRMRSSLAAAFPLAMRDQQIEQSVIDSSIPLLANWLASGLGRIYLWSFEIEAWMENCLIDLWHNQKRPAEVQQIYYRETKVEITPFKGCQLCSEKCHYRFFANLAFLDRNESDDLLQTARKYLKQPSLDTKQDLLISLKYQSNRLIDADSPSVQNVNICLFSQMCDRIGLQGAALQKMINSLEKELSSATDNLAS